MKLEYSSEEYIAELQRRNFAFPQLTAIAVAYNDPISYAYYGKTEPQRVAFLQLLLNAPIASVKLTPS